MLFPGFGSLFLIFPGALEACTWCSGACLLGERQKLRQSRLCHQLITPDHGATSLYNFHMLPSLFTWKIFWPSLKLQFDRAGAGALGCSWLVHAWSTICLKRFSSLWLWTLRCWLSWWSSAWSSWYRWLWWVPILTSLLSQLDSGGEMNMIMEVMNIMK